MSQKTIIITGVSGSLGTAVLKKLLPLQHKLVLIARKTEKLSKLMESQNYPAENYLIFSGDITSDQSIRELFTKTVEKFKHIDVLIHIAGTYLGGKPIYKSEPQMWDDLFNLNAKSFFLLIKTIVPSMIDHGSGIIVSIGSKNALELSPNSGIYAASKAVTVKLTQTLAKELIDKNIRVNCVLPSIIDTKANRDMMPDNDFSNWVKPESIADVIQFLISDEAKDITGTTIPVYGKEL